MPSDAKQAITFQCGKAEKDKSDGSIKIVISIMSGEIHVNATLAADVERAAGKPQGSILYGNSVPGQMILRWRNPNVTTNHHKAAKEFVNRINKYLGSLSEEQLARYTEYRYIDALAHPANGTGGGDKT